MLRNIQAVRQLVRDEHVEKVVVAYHGVGFSDIMQTHMIHHEIQEELGLQGDHPRALDPVLGYPRPF